MKIELPEPVLSTSTPVETVLKSRRSLREFSDKGVSMEQLSQLLWAAQGISGEGGKKTAPSAGAQYPLQAYVVVSLVTDLPVAVYRYDGSAHALHFAVEGDLRAALCEAALEDQPWIGQAAMIMVLTANFDDARDHFRTQPPEGKRGARYVYIETGAVTENVHLQATALGIGAVLVGGFNDVKVKALLRLPPELEPTALLCMGVPLTLNTLDPKMSV